MRLRLGALIVCSVFLIGCGDGGGPAKSIPGGRADQATASPSRPTPAAAPVLAEAAGEAREAAGEAKAAADELQDVQSPSESEFNTESYAQVSDNPFLNVQQNPLSTFSIDVDTASYANLRRFLRDGQWPPPGAVRIEEMLNYFTYDYPAPSDGAPFSANVEIANCPWNAEHRLVRIGLKGKEIARDKHPVSNLVFLLDVSGSMNEPNKLPLLKEAMKLLVDQLTENDRVAIVVYAGASGVVLDSTTADHKQQILSALHNLQAGGSTNGGAGIQLAYKIAAEHFIPKGTNRVIIATDGDFNVGVTSEEQLVQLIEDKARSGVFLSVLGFGTGNYKDSMMEKLADKGNGNYAYIDTLNEGRKVLVDQMQGTLITIAKDVKIQIEFNPAQASAYRLIGYENRILAKEDFNDDKKDAGEIGAGHTVTALYEVVPAGRSIPVANVDALKYQAKKPVAAAPVSIPADSDNPSSKELLTLKLRYKQPDGDQSQLLEFPVADDGKKFSQATSDFAWASAVAGFGMVMRNSEYKGGMTLPAVLEIARSSKGEDPLGYRAEFIELVERALTMKSNPHFVERRALSR